MNERLGVPPTVSSADSWSKPSGPGGPTSSGPNPSKNESAAEQEPPSDPMDPDEVGSQKSSKAATLNRNQFSVEETFGAGVWVQTQKLTRVGQS